MKTPHDRNITILDGLTLIAATAVGFTLVRQLGMRLNPTFLRSQFSIPVTALMLANSSVLYYVTPVLACWTVAWFGLCVSARGSIRRRAFRAPGYVALFAATLALALGLGRALLYRLAGLRDGALSPQLVFELQRGASHAVFISLATLWLVGLWRPLPTLRDRIGRAIGATWIACQVLAQATMFVEFAIR